MSLLTENRDKLDLVANALIEFEKLDGPSFDRLFSSEQTAQLDEFKEEPSEPLDEINKEQE